MPRRDSWCRARSRWARPRPLAIHAGERLEAKEAIVWSFGTELEDLAGNSVAQPFEVDAAGPISSRVTTKTVELPFQIGPGLRADGSRVASRARVAQPVVEIRWA